MRPMMEDLTPLPRRSTITDVAREAGVAIKTVSRVVRQEPNVSDKTREVVRAAIDKLNYRPTMAARSTVSNRSFLIGLVFDNPNPAYSIDLLRGAQHAARENGYHLVVEPIEEAEGGPVQQITDLIIQSNLEGLILPPPLSDDPAILAALRKLGRPVARIAPSIEPDLGLAVGMDDVAAARAMTEHLIALGHRRIGFVVGREGTATTRKRLEGYRAAMANAGLRVGDDDVVQGDFQMRGGLLAGEALLARTHRPTAIFASNDDMAAGVMIAALKAGLSVPDDVSVAGFDDSVTASTMWPQITTIRQPVADLAATAAQRLIDYQRKGPKGASAPAQLDFELIVRGSTGPAPRGE